MQMITAIQGALAEKQPMITVEGILKRTAEEIVAAVAGQDYQEPLEAGDNITIDGNVISAVVPQGTVDHRDLTNRDAVDQHPMAAIIGLLTALDGIDTDISGVTALIPEQASELNELADKAFVNSSLENVAAYYITKDAAGNPFATKAELNAATVFYSGGYVRTPTRNDYTVVLADESKTIEATGENPTTRYHFSNGWQYQYTVNNSGLTAAQWSAVTSGITAALVTKLTGIDMTQYRTVSDQDAIDSTKVGASQFTVTIPSASWTSSGGYYSKTVTVSGIKATYAVPPVIDCVLSGSNATNDKALLEAFANIVQITTAANSITVKAIDAKPTVDIPIVIEVWE